MKNTKRKKELSLNKTIVASLDILQLKIIRGACGMPTDGCGTNEKDCLYGDIGTVKESRTCYDTMDC